MLEILWALGAFIITLGILVTFHEFGHFWVARRCGVKVLTFSVGFGKPLWQRQAADGTSYQIGMIPLGGYVRMLDARVDDVSPEEWPQSFNAQSVGKRMAIVAAGPIANFVLAIGVLWLMLVIGVPSVKPIIGNVAQQSVAAEAGIKAPAEVLAVNGKETRDWQEVNMALVSAIGDDQAELQIRDLADRHESSKRYQLDLSQWEFDEQQSTFGSLGIQPYQSEVTTEIGYVAPGSPAEQAGLQENDKIVGVDGTLNPDWSRIRERIAAAAGDTLVFDLVRNNEQLQIPIAIGEREFNGETIGFLGVETKVMPYPEEYRFTHQYGLLGGLWEGTTRTWDLMVLSVKMIGKLVTGDVSVRNLSGPVSIAEGAGTTASYGLVYFLGFLALISVNLGIINLLPLPILDGGHLVFFVIEWIRGKPVSERIQEISYRIGGVLIFALMAVAIGNDIARLSL